MKNHIILLFFITLVLSCKKEIKREQTLVKEKTNYPKTTKINCDVESLQSFYSLIKSDKQIYEKDIFMFLSDRNHLCKTNSEYGKLENEIIFMLIESETQSFVLLLGSQNQQTIDYVLSILKKPIKNNFSLKELQQKVVNLKPENLEIKEFPLKNNVIESLNIAMKNQKNKQYY